MKNSLIIKYAKNTFCPSCNGKADEQGQLTLGKYRFGPPMIEYPEQGYVSILKCNACGLFYKDYVPERKESQKIICGLAPDVWNNKSPAYDKEANCLVNIIDPLDNFNVLDVGGGDGKFLRAMTLGSTAPEQYDHMNLIFKGEE